MGRQFGGNQMAGEKSHGFAHVDSVPGLAACPRWTRARTAFRKNRSPPSEEIAWLPINKVRGGLVQPTPGFREYHCNVNRNGGFHVMSNVKLNRVSQLAGEQKLIDGTKQFLWQLQSIPVGSQMVTPPEIVKVLDDRIALVKAAIAAADARAAAVKAERDERTKTTPFVNSLKRMVVGMFSQSPNTLGVFGLKAPKVAKRTVASKSVAVEKVAATRKARNTMGPKARKSVKGTVPSTATKGGGSEPTTGGQPSAANKTGGSEPTTGGSSSASAGSTATKAGA
jgi:hypothetical protein